MLEKLKQISEVIWELPAEGDMKVPARVYSSKDMLKLIEKDKSLVQLRNVATLPGIQKYSLVMPDVHEGYGFPMGGVEFTGNDTKEAKCENQLIEHSKEFSEYPKQNILLILANNIVRYEVLANHYFRIFNASEPQVFYVLN
jgi:hypothetical protein